jgi:hypothetical protein
MYPCIHFYDIRVACICWHEKCLCSTNIGGHPNSLVKCGLDKLFEQLELGSVQAWLKLKMSKLFPKACVHTQIQFSVTSMVIGGLMPPHSNSPIYVQITVPLTHRLTQQSTAQTQSPVTTKRANFSPSSNWTPWVNLYFPPHPSHCLLPLMRLVRHSRVGSDPASNCSNTGHNTKLHTTQFIGIYGLLNEFLLRHLSKTWWFLEKTICFPVPLIQSGLTEITGLEQAELRVEVIFFISNMHDLPLELLRDELNLISFCSSWAWA